MNSCRRAGPLVYAAGCRIRFGRVPFWFEDSPASFAAAVSLCLVLAGFLWLNTLRHRRHPVDIATVAMQPLLVEVPGLLGGTGGARDDRTAAELVHTSFREENPDAVADPVPDLPELADVIIELRKVLTAGQDADTVEALLRQTSDEIRKAKELLRSPRSSVSSADPISARFFGLGEEGANSVVYVIDCSLSMDQPSYKFESAKRELIRSINSLKSEHRFFVIFFAGSAVPMPGSELMAATESNKKKAIEWIRNVGVQPNTLPVAAMRQAIGLRPEVIYLLSDGEFLNKFCDEIRLANGGTSPATIYTVGFGNRSGEPQLVRIASESGGKYRYVEFVQHK
ncbi:MAG: VWA domain-containing protein [Planctomycetes bacterium]|nr:VWA domain-containing protein [Planctomycetota bacterium]